MRIDTEICENFVGCYDEARGMALGKRQILERESSKILSFMQRKLVVFGLWFVFGVLLSFFAEYSEAVLPIVCIIFVASMVYVAANLLEIYKSYRAKKEARFIGHILIDKDGVTDEAHNGVKTSVEMDKILGVSIGKYTVTVLTDTPIYFFFPLSDKERVLKAFKKNNKKVRIIEQ